MMLFIATVSGFINNTPVVALLIPIVIQAAKESNISSSKLLIPLSYASIFGCMCTLIGTSTNILVDGLARQTGEAGFDMFTLAPAGIFMFLASILYYYYFRRSYYRTERLNRMRTIVYRCIWRKSN